MAFTKKLIDLIGIVLTLMVLSLPSTAANIDCNGKPFHCVNSTHFMICVDLGSGVSSTIDDFVLACPPPTVCQRTNKFECDFPVDTSTTDAPTAFIVTSVSEIETVTKPYDLTTTVPYEQYFDTSSTIPLSEDILITHQTTVTESTIRLVTDVIQNDEVMIPQFKSNETVPSIEVQNDTNTTSLPNNISLNTTGTTSNAFGNDNVPNPETTMNPTVTENILSTDVARNDRRTTSTLPNNISASDLDVFPVDTEEVNIVTHESITNSSLNQTIQRAIENATNENTSNNTNLPSEITDTSPSLDGIQNDVTKPLPLNISANITDIFNNTAEKINITISGPETNLTVIETDPSVLVDLVTTVLSNNGSNITDVIKDSTENITLAASLQNFNETIPSITNVTQNEHSLLPATALPYITDSTTESILYNGTETISTTQNNSTGLIPTNSNATNIFLEETEKVNYTLNQTTPNVDVVQPESTTTLTNNMDDYVIDLIPNATETIAVIKPDLTVQSVTDIAQTEPTLLSDLSISIITSNVSGTITESIITEVTKLPPNETYLSNAALPIHITDTTTESILNKVSENTPKIQVKSDITTQLPDNASTRDYSLDVFELNLNSTLNKTTPTFQSDTMQNKHKIISTSNSNVLPNYATETITEVTKVTEIALSAQASKTTLSADVLQNNDTTLLSYLIKDTTTDVTMLIPESANNYSLNTRTSGLDIRQNDSTSPLPSIRAYTAVFITDTTGNENDVNNTNSASNETIQNKTIVAQNEHALLLNLSGSTALPEKPYTDTESILTDQTTPHSTYYFEKNNVTTPLSEYNTLNRTELIPVLSENVNVSTIGPEINFSETIRSITSVRNDTMSIALDSNIDIDSVTATTKSVEVPESIRNMTLNETLPSPADSVHNYSNTLPNNNVDIATESILGIVEKTPSLSINVVQNYLPTSYASNTILPDTLVDIVTELPVTDVTENVNVATVRYNPTLSYPYLRNPANSLNSLQTNERIFGSESIVPNDIQKPYVQDITDLPLEIEPTEHTDNASILSVKEIYKENSTTIVTVTPSSTKPVTESYNGASTSSLMNNSKNVTNFVETTTVLPEEIDKISFSNMNNTNQAVLGKTENNHVTINNDSNAINNENLFATSFPNHLAESISSQNFEKSIQQTEIRNDSYVESQILESIKSKPAGIIISTQTTLSSLSVDSVQSEITSGPTINPGTPTSTIVIANTGQHINSVNTVQKETDITIPEHVTNTFQTDTPQSDTVLLGNAFITNPAATKSVQTSVTESYSPANDVAKVNADVNILMESSSSAVNIGIESTKVTNSISVLNSSSEQLPYRGQPTTATMILSTSTPTQDTVNPTPTTNILFALGVPSTLKQDNISGSVNQDSYTEPTINIEMNLQNTPSNEISTNKAIHTIQNTDPLNDIFTTAMNKTQEINNTENHTHALGITSENKQDAVLDKSNLPMSERNLTSQNQDIIIDGEKITLQDILLNTPKHLLHLSTTSQRKDTAQYTSVSTLSIFNLDAANNYDFTNRVLIKVEHGTQIDGTDKTNLESIRNNGTKLEEGIDLKHVNENETILTMNVRPNQPMKENPQISNDSLTSIARALSVKFDQDNVTSNQNIADNRIIRPSTETWPAKAVTEPHIGEDKVTLKQFPADNPTINPSTEAWRAKVLTDPHIDEDKVTLKQFSADNPTINPSTEAWRAKVVTEPHIGEDKVTLKQFPADNPTIRHSTEAWRAKVVTEPHIGEDKVTFKQFPADNPTMRPSTEAWRAKVVTEPHIGEDKVTLKQFPADNPTIRPSTEAWRAKVVTEPHIGEDKVTLKQFPADNPTINPSTEAWRAKVVTDPHIGEDKVTLKQFPADNLTIRPSTEAWRAKVVTEPHIGEDKVILKQFPADNPTINPSIEAWRTKVVTESYIGEGQVTTKQYSADTSTLSPSTKPLQAVVVTIPHIDQYKAISTQDSADILTLRPSTEPWRGIEVTNPYIEVTITPPPVTEIEPTETRGKLPAISDTINTASKPNEGKTMLKQRVTSTNEDERLLIDKKSITEAFKESLNIEPQNGEDIVQSANKSGLGNLQSNYESTSNTELIYNPKTVITQTTEQVISKTSDSKLDKGIVMIHAVKTSNAWSIKDNSPTGTNLGISSSKTLKGDQSEPEEIEREQSEINEEQAEYEENKKEEQLEALENNKDELNKVSPKIRKMSPVNEYVNVDDRVTLTRNKIRLESTIEMTTKKAEEKSNSQHKFTNNIEVQPATVTFKEDFKPTNVANDKSPNTHNAAAPVFVPVPKRNFVCEINSRGKFPDNNDCRKFYICSGKLEPIEGLCPNNTVFSELRKQCTKNVSHCVRNNQLQCVREGRFSDYFNDNIYYICLKNNLNTFTRFKLQCLSGYHLNKTSVRCALNTESSRPTSQQSISDVSNNSEQSVPSSRNEKLVIESSDQFECNKEGKFPDPNNCRKYYVCSKKNGKSRYRLKRKKCDSDELFHRDKKKCVDADSYDCD